MKGIKWIHKCYCLLFLLLVCILVLVVTVHKDLPRPVTRFVFQEPFSLEEHIYIPGHLCTLMGTKTFSMCSFCKMPTNVVSIYVESFEQMVEYYPNRKDFVTEIPSTCTMPDGVRCVVQHDNPTADVVFRMSRLVHSDLPVRYCYPQIFALLNSEAETSGYDRGLLRFTDLRVDHHLESDVLYHDVCDVVDLKEAENTDRSADKRTGIALVVSNCRARWRYNYLEHLMQHVPIDSYGHCLHNKDSELNDHRSWRKSMIEIGRKYRMVISFENTVVKDYISEKIFHIYQSGAIPVYWGPSDIYKWVPGNHTFIDASTFNEPKELAAYLKRVVDDDSLFKHHTTNFDWDKTANMIKTHCPPVNYMCGVCRAAYDKVVKRRTHKEQVCSCGYNASVLLPV
jgi:hypothetical protein